MPELDSWIAFFDANAHVYHENPLAQHASAEVEFLAELLALPQGATLLDVGCGTGRHAIGMTKKGYGVTGLDICPNMLAQAREAASANGVEVAWVLGDALEYVAEKPVDAVICLHEGGLNLLAEGEDPDAHDRRILANVAGSLRAGGLFALTALNGLKHIREIADADVQSGAFDVRSSVRIIETSGPDGSVLHLRERVYTPHEMVDLLESEGFEVLQVWGGTGGDWGRRPVRLDEDEVFYYARKR